MAVMAMRIAHRAEGLIVPINLWRTRGAVLRLLASRLLRAVL